MTATSTERSRDLGDFFVGLTFVALGAIELNKGAHLDGAMWLLLATPFLVAGHFVGRANRIGGEAGAKSSRAWGVAFMSVGLPLLATIIYRDFSS